MGSKVNGDTIRVILGGCGVFQKKAKELFAAEGVDTDNIPEWADYNQLKNVLFALEKAVGSNLLVEIGKFIPKEADLPPQIDTFEKGILSLNIAYQMNHQVAPGEGIGEYKTIQENPTTIRVICDTPAYPAKVNLGLIKGMANRFGANPIIDEVSLEGGGEFLISL